MSCSFDSTTKTFDSTTECTFDFYDPSVTRLGLSGITRSQYGSFAGKTEEIIVVVRDTVTRLGLSAITRGLYGDFSGKTEEGDTGSTGVWWFMARRRSRR